MDSMVEARKNMHKRDAKIEADKNQHQKRLKTSFSDAARTNNLIFLKKGMN